MKCNKCKKEISYFNSYGSMFHPTIGYCKECWWNINGFKEEVDIEERVDILEKKVDFLLTKKGEPKNSEVKG